MELYKFCIGQNTCSAAKLFTGIHVLQLTSESLHPEPQPNGNESNAWVVS